jgi:CubicO group peptidase (beta-lactamase class C family)
MRLDHSLRGAPVSASTPVYRAMGQSDTPADLEPRKRALTLEHLLTMSSGLDCDDSASSGNENALHRQTGQADWYRYTLDLKMVRAPGEKAVYGSANPNLAGGVLARTTGRWLRWLLLPPLEERVLLLPGRQGCPGGFATLGHGDLGG